MKSFRNGFTLIELMIVVAIIGVIVAIAIPQFSNLTIKSQEGSTKGNLGAIRSALSIYYGDNEGASPYDNLDSLKMNQKYLQAIPLAILPQTAFNIGHGSHNGVRTGTYPANISDVIGGVNGWVYDNTGESSTMWGTVFVNCTHMDLRGSVWTAY